MFYYHGRFIKTGTERSRQNPEIKGKDQIDDRPNVRKCNSISSANEL